MSIYNLIAGFSSSFPATISVAINGAGGAGGSIETPNRGGNGAAGAQVSFNLNVNTSDVLIIGPGRGGVHGTSGINRGGGAGGQGLTGTGTSYNGGSGGNAGGASYDGSGGGGGAASIVLLNGTLVGIAAGGGGGGGGGLISAGKDASVTATSQTSIYNGKQGSNKGSGNAGGGGGGGGAGYYGGLGGTTNTGDAGGNAGESGGSGTFGSFIASSPPRAILPGSGAPGGLGATLTSTTAGNGSDGSVVISYPSSFKQAATVTGTYTLAITGGNYVYTFTGPGTFSLVNPQIYNLGGTAVSVNLTSTNLLYQFGTSVNLVATISNSAATGSVVFYDGTTALATVPVVGGVATLTTSDISVNYNQSTNSYTARSIYAVYTGDGTFATNTSNSLAINVSPRSTTSSINISPTSGQYGTVITITGSMTSGSTSVINPTGTISIYDGSAVIGTINLSGTSQSPSGTITVNNLVVGTHNLYAYYSGDTSYAASTSSTLTETVTTIPTTTTLTASPTTTAYGNYVALTATVSPSGGTGTVTFYDSGSALGSASLSNGTAVLNSPNIAVGSRTITAVYSGDSQYYTSTSAGVGVRITQIQTAIALTATSTSVNEGTTVTFTATLTPSSTTNAPVIFFINGNQFASVTSSSGIATANYTFNSAGSYTITAQYTGSTNYSGVTTSGLVVNSNKINPASVNLGLSTTSLNKSQTVTMSVSVVRVSGYATPTGTATWYYAGQNVGSAQLDGNGNASITVGLGPTGTNGCYVVYSGDSVYNSVQSSTSYITNYDAPGSHDDGTPGTRDYQSPYWQSYIRFQVWGAGGGGGGAGNGNAGGGGTGGQSWFSYKGGGAIASADGGTGGGPGNGAGSYGGGGSGGGARGGNENNTNGNNGGGGYANGNGGGGAGAPYGNGGAGAYPGGGGNGAGYSFGAGSKGGAYTAYTAGGGGGSGGYTQWVDTNIADRSRLWTYNVGGGGGGGGGSAGGGNGGNGRVLITWG